jgi:UDP-N-acetylglucosamine 2-epimerase
MRVLTIIGNRPQFVKAAAVSRRLREVAEELIVHTGQHYDDQLSRIFFEELSVPAPARQLRTGSGTSIEQTARILSALEPVLGELRPDLALVYGDTNSTLAGALASAQAGVGVGHVEAGMRCFDRAMPEELNRVLTDHLSELLLCSTPVAVENLRREGIAEHAHLVGDVMVDVLLRFRDIAEERSGALEELGVEPGSYLLVTAHRAGNVDDPQRLRLLVELLRALPGPVVLPLHPRTRRRLSENGVLEVLEGAPGLLLTAPLGYLDFLKLTRHARAVLTDSGGMQKEAYVLGVPCVTLRDRTEWVETVEAGWNVLVDLDRDAALAALDRRPPTAPRPELYGGGHAAERVRDVVSTYTDRR